METLAIDGSPNWLEPSEQQGLLHQGWEEGMGASDSVVGPKAHFPTCVWLTVPALEP